MNSSVRRKETTVFAEGTQLCREPVGNPICRAKEIARRGPSAAGAAISAFR